MTAREALTPIRNGAAVPVSGFTVCGIPEILIDALAEKNVKKSYRCL
ncbi:MAG: hypothetical protein LBS24_05780 [Clostridiales Family XIII bacterium]|jgi:acyl CoA:acetate/3-ketoacid CoA transferase alpha subunit|nr:hypothetical protein [Clostridiales Family XIII bacterium]